MTKIVSDITMSLDGYVAGPNPTIKDPLGIGGEHLHDWATRLAQWRKPHGLEGGEIGIDGDVIKESFENIGAFIMGRLMFDGGKGPWETDTNKNGWWGDTPPFHAPVFVLTSHKRDPLVMKGGTTFIFITDGIKHAHAEAKKVAGNKNISIAGGASAIQQAINAKLLEEIQVHISPIFLGGGTKLFENIGTPVLEKTRVIDSPFVTHIRYRLQYT